MMCNLRIFALGRAVIGRRGDELLLRMSVYSPTAAEKRTSSIGREGSRTAVRRVQQSTGQVARKQTTFAQDTCTCRFHVDRSNSDRSFIAATMRSSASSRPTIARAKPFRLETILVLGGRGRWGIGFRIL